MCPVLPPHLEEYWRVWVQLDAFRGHGLAGALPLTMADIVSYCEGVLECPHWMRVNVIEACRILDGELFKFHEEQRQKEEKRNRKAG